MNILTEFDQEKYDRCRRREGYEDGKKEGAIETAKKMLMKGLSQEIISDCTGLSLDEITELQSEELA